MKYVHQIFASKLSILFNFRYDKGLENLKEKFEKVKEECKEICKLFESKIKELSIILKIPDILCNEENKEKFKEKVIIVASKTLDKGKSQKEKGEEPELETSKDLPTYYFVKEYKKLTFNVEVSRLSSMNIIWTKIANPKYYKFEVTLTRNFDDIDEKKLIDKSRDINKEKEKEIKIIKFIENKDWEIERNDDEKENVYKNGIAKACFITTK